MVQNDRGNQFNVLFVDVLQHVNKHVFVRSFIHLRNCDKNISQQYAVQQIIVGVSLFHSFQGNQGLCTAISPVHTCMTIYTVQLQSYCLTLQA